MNTEQLAVLSRQATERLANVRAEHFDRAFLEMRTGDLRKLFELASEQPLSELLAHRVQVLRQAIKGMHPKKMCNPLATVVRDLCLVAEAALAAASAPPDPQDKVPASDSPPEAPKGEGPPEEPSKEDTPTADYKIADRQSADDAQGEATDTVPADEGFDPTDL